MERGREMRKIGKDLWSFGGDLREKEMGERKRAARVWEMGKEVGEIGFRAFS